jgi:hypothetical protein
MATNLYRECFGSASIADARKQHNAFMRESLRPARALVNKDLLVSEMVDHLVRFRIKYLPKKQLLLDRWEDGHTQAVSRALKDYTDTLKDMFERAGKAVVFDDALFDVALQLLRLEGYEKADAIAQAAENCGV